MVASPHFPVVSQHVMPEIRAMIRYSCPSVKSLIIRHEESGACRLLPIRCKRWRCQYCARKNLQKLLRRIRDGNPTKFITLTCLRQSTETLAECHDRHRIQIRRLIAKIRKHSSSFEACIICEQTKAGNPHWHLVARCHYLAQRTLSDWWFKLTGSKIVDIRAIKNPRHAACYVAKYITKSVGWKKPEWMKRVYQFTGKYHKLPKVTIPEGYNAEVINRHPEVTAANMTPWYGQVDKDEKGWTFWPTYEAYTQGHLWDWLSREPAAPA